jgi:hypothetical protein
LSAILRGADLEEVKRGSRSLEGEGEGGSKGLKGVVVIIDIGGVSGTGKVY